MRLTERNAVAKNLKRHLHDKRFVGPDKELLAPQHRLLVVRSSNVNLSSTKCLNDHFDLKDKKGSVFTSSNIDSLVDAMHNITKN